MIKNKFPSSNLDKYLAYMDADGNVSYVLPSKGNSSNGNVTSPIAGATTKPISPTTPNVPTSPTINASNIITPNTGFTGTGSSNKGVTEEGAIIGDSKVNNSTFNNISTGTTSKPSSNTKSDYIPTTTIGSLPSGSFSPSKDETDETPSPSTGNTASNQFFATYQGTDFLEWYKANYGTDYDPSYGFARKSGMSDVDWDIGNSLYDFYRIGEQRKSEYDSSVSDVERSYGSQIELAEKNRDYSTGEATKRADSSLSQLEQYYNLSKDALDKSKRQSQQNASITLDKLKKYLPTQIKAQGLGGLGVSESTMLQAYNDYTSDMGTIDSEYQKNKTDLETNYQDNRRSVESERDSAINAANNTYDTSMATLGESKAQALSDLEGAYSSDNLSAWQTAKDSVSSIFDKYKEKFEEGLKQAYQDAYSTVSQSTETDESKILEYIEQFRGKLSDNDFLTLTQQAKQIAQANREQAEEQAEEKAENENKTTQQNTYSAGLQTIANLDYISSEEMEKYIRQNYSGRVTESQLNDMLVAGESQVKANLRTVNNRRYDSESTNLETMYQSMLSTSDGKISQKDYNTLAAYVEKIGNELGEDYRKLLESTLNGYAMSIRSADEQMQADKEALIDKWRNGVSDGFTVHSTYGGGFSVGNGMKVKIKDGDQGMSLATFAKKAEKSGSNGLNSGEAGWFGSEKKDSKAIAKLAKEGKLANGTIVDTNAGSGTKYWVYLNGYFYRIELVQ